MRRLLVALLLCLAFHTSHAAIVQGSFTGVLDPGTATGGLFGLAAGESLVGRQFDGIFTYDTSQLLGPFAVVPGATQFNNLAISPTVSSISTTLNGQTITITGDQVTRVYLYSGFSGSQSGFALVSQTNPGSNVALSFITAGSNPVTDLTNPAIVNFSASPAGAESLFTFSYYYNYNAATNSYLSLQTLHGKLTALSVAPVPLPAAAWLLLSGLGGLGFVARRKAA